MSRVAELAARRDGLLLRSAALRREFTHHTAELDHCLRRVDRGIGMVRNLTSRPLLLAGGAALLLALGPAKAFRWVSRGLLVTSFVRRAYGFYASRRVRRDDPDDQLFV